MAGWEQGQAGACAWRRECRGGRQRRLLAGCQGYASLAVTPGACNGRPPPPAGLADLASPLVRAHTRDSFLTLTQLFLSLDGFQSFLQTEQVQPVEP